jgi:hypothetical protein
MSVPCRRCVACGAVLVVNPNDYENNAAIFERHKQWHEELELRLHHALTVGESGDRAAQMSQPLGG